MSQLGKHTRYAWIIVPVALLAAFVVIFADAVTVTGTIDESELVAACAAGNLLCDYVQPEDVQLLQRAAAGHQLRKVNLFQVVGLQRFECG